MNFILFFVITSYLIIVETINGCHCIDEINERKAFDKDFTMEYTPPMQTNEILMQQFNCNNGSNIKEVNYLRHFKTKISCNDWTFKRMDVTLNLTTSDGKLHELSIPNADSISAHVNGHLIMNQKGVISGGICNGAKFEKIVFNLVDSDACDGHGVTHQKTVYATIKMTNTNGNHFCEAFCFGTVSVYLAPGVTNIKIDTNSLDQLFVGTVGYK